MPATPVIIHVHSRGAPFALYFGPSSVIHVPDSRRSLLASQGRLRELLALTWKPPLSSSSLRPLWRLRSQRHGRLLDKVQQQSTTMIKHLRWTALTVTSNDILIDLFCYLVLLTPNRMEEVVQCNVRMLGQRFHTDVSLEERLQDVVKEAFHSHQREFM